MEMTGLEKFPTVGTLKELAKNYSESVRLAHEQGNCVGYVTAAYPVELLRAMDIVPFYPENYSVICVARHAAEELFSAAETQGYSRDLCAYARCGMGSIFFKGDNPAGQMPTPDFLLPCNTQCGTLTKWFENMGKLFKIPVVLLDAPFVRGTAPYPHALNYFIKQMENLVRFLEEQTKKKLDIDRLREIVDYSAKACNLWNEVLDLARYRPAPWTIFDVYFHIAPMVTHRGTKECVDYYEGLKTFLIRRVEAKFPAIKNERYRFYFDNIPMWYRLKEQSILMGSYGVAILASLYTHSWGYQFDSRDPIRSLAENYLAFSFCNRDIPTRASMTLDLMQRYGANGYIFHVNRSCKAEGLGGYDIMRFLQKRTGIPGLAIDGDMGDARFFSEEQFKMRLESYLELLDSGSIKGERS